MILTIILTVLILATLVFLFLIWRKLSVPSEDKSSLALQGLEPSLQLLHTNLRALENTVHERMTSSEDRLNQNLQFQTNQSRMSAEEMATRMNLLTEQLSRLDETNKQVMSFTEQLRSFQDILKNPKQRGILGEYYLETVLKNVLPPDSFSMQYHMDDGMIADAVVFVRDKIVPIDSKFSLENYNRITEATEPSEKLKYEKLFITDLKTRITETAKYIQPNRGTMEFAFMFIPHEAIYYDLLINKIGMIQDEDTESLIERAARKYHVIIVSPTSFLAYLQTVLQGLRALVIEESAREIRKNVEELAKHMKTYEEYHGKLGTTMSTLVNHYNASGKEFKKIDKDITRITGDKLALETIEIERPVLE